MHRLAIALVLVAATAAAQDLPPVSTTVVPVVGSTFGVSMARWLTDVEIVNETGLPVDVAIELSSVPDAPVFFLTLGPGQAQRFTDIVGQAFGLETALSPLRITTGGRRSVTVRATAYAVRGTDLSPLQPIAVYGGETWFPIRVLDGLAFSEELRTNIGLANLGEQDAMFILGLQRVPGRNVAVTQIRVAAGTLVHTSIQSLFPMITNGGGFSVVVETSARQTHIYASVIRNSDNGASFITPRLGTR
ncbi:MAG: hypothetical protein M3P06_23255 [Acidobacteriota bacterium]|nr:hypothetical protein [Acidobacteriota bacterium]